MIDIDIVIAGRVFAMPAKYYHLVATACVYNHVGFEFVLGRRQTKVTRMTLSSIEGEDAVIPVGLMHSCSQLAALAGHRFVVRQDVMPPRDVFIPDFYRLGTVDWRYRQFDAFCAIAQERSGVFDCVTAYGKTFLIGKIAKAYQHARILVVIPGVQLGKEVFQRLCAELSPERVGQLGGGKRDIVNRRVIVTTPQSLHHIEADWPDVVIFDEVHQAASTETANALMEFGRAKMFGFSGSVDERTDNADKRVEAIFGKVLMEIDYVVGVQQGLITPITLKFVKVPRGVQTDLYTNDIDRLRYPIWANECRNQRIIAETLAYLNAGENNNEQALILVDKLEHGLYIQQAGMLAGLTIPVICGATNATQVKKLERHGAWREESVVIDDVDDVAEFRKAFGRGEHRVAIGTAALMTGADFPRLSFGVYASSLTTAISQQQSAGRQMRRSPGKESATMLDCYDVFCPKAFDRTKSRIRGARSEGWNVEIVE